MTKRFYYIAKHGAPFYITDRACPMADNVIAKVWDAGLAEHIIADLNASPKPYNTSCLYD